MLYARLKALSLWGDGMFLKYSGCFVPAVRKRIQKKQVLLGLPVCGAGG